MSWTAPVGATSYTVQQSFNGGAWTTLTTGITTASISVTSAPGGSYAYQVSASNSYGTGGWAVSPAISVTQVPATPTDVVLDKTTWVLWHVEGDPLALGKTPPRSTSQVEFHRFVDSIDSLRIPVRTRATQDGAALPEAPAGSVLDHLRQRRDQLSITYCGVSRRPVIRRSRKPDAFTGPAERARMHLDEVLHRLTLARRS